MCFAPGQPEQLFVSQLEASPCKLYSFVKFRFEFFECIYTGSNLLPWVLTCNIWRNIAAFVRSLCMQVPSQWHVRSLLLHHLLSFAPFVCFEKHIVWCSRAYLFKWDCKVGIDFSIPSTIRCYWFLAHGSVFTDGTVSNIAKSTLSFLLLERQS